jgi:hypothetical protein
MDVALQSQVAFHLTGRRPEGDVAQVEPLELRPALLARYRDLTALRYDFPVVAVENEAGDGYVQALSGVVDGILREIAQGEDSERVTRHVLRVERQIRALAAAGMSGSLTALWNAAAERLGASDDASLRDSLTRARAVLRVDGEVLDCDAAMPARLARHAWNIAQQGKARSFSENVRRLIQRLSDIVGADFARSEAGRSAESLKASMGSAHAEMFDFAAMSRVLKGASREAALPAARRDRIHSLLDTLESQKFFAVPGQSAAAVERHAFVFDSCTGALAACRETRPKVIALAKAMAMAELEIAGEWREAQHAALFDGYGEDGLDPKEQASFPDYLVCINSRRLTAAENAALMEILSTGLPIKVLVQIDDILGAPPNGKGAFGLRNHPLANMAIGLNHVFVMQSCSANLFQFRGRLRAGFAYPGAALFSVFSGASPVAPVRSPYLVAATAMESRAFPAFSFDPSAGPDWASRFDLGGNPQPERDWPVHAFSYEDEGHQTVTEDIAFTLVDFIAADPRHARHLAPVARATWNRNMVPAADAITRAANGPADQVPYLMMVDADDTLHRVIVADTLMREARRCRENWHSLQELAGIHNSHAARLLARESQARAERESPAVEAAAGHAPEAAPAAVAPTPAPASAAPAEAPAEKAPGEAYIETPRCTTCNECTNINDKMFAYNENKQAYIKDAAAGTYAQLVEAAESCQVSIIHPGLPRDANEPGLEELKQRAEAFK